MNVLIVIFLIFAMIGLLDKIIGSRWGLSEPFDRGLFTMGSMVIPTISTCCIAVELIQRNICWIESITEPLPFDASLVAGLLLAPDTGGFFIAKQLAGDPAILVFNGVIVAGLFGQTISYQIPIFLSSLDKTQQSPIMRGFVVGIIIIPVGLIVAELFLKISMEQFVWHFLPIFTLCLIMAIGLIKAFKMTIKVFSTFAAGIQIVVNIMFIVTVIGVFFPRIAYVEVDAVESALIIVFRAAIVISGSMVISELILKYCQDKIRKIAQMLGVNEVSIVAMLLNFATSLAIIPLIPKMDDKGKMMNAAFSVSGAYVFGGQLGFVSSVTGGETIMILVISKLICGGLSVFLVHKLYKNMA